MGSLEGFVDGKLSVFGLTGRFGSFRSWIGQTLTAHPRKLAVALAILVALPGLQAGLMIDDWAHAAVALGKIAFHPGPSQMYDFGDGNPARMLAAQDIGYPWFAVPEIKVRFFRPLSSWLTWADHAWLGGAPALAHAISIALYALVVAGVAALLVGTLGPGLGGLAAVLYALDDAHCLPAVWLANRNALVATAPAVWATVAWLRFRQHGWQPGRWLAVLGFAVGLAGGETALSALALPVCFELFGGPRLGQRWQQRLRALWPLLVLAGCYAAMYKSLGYGARHSGAYIDPVSDPSLYLAAAALRIPSLVGVMTLNTPVEISVALPGSIWLFAGLGVMGAAGVAALFFKGLAAHGADARHGMLWLVSGSLLALVPVAATFPAGRLLSVASIGGAVVVAAAVAPLLAPLARATGTAVQAVTAGWRAAAMALAVIHLVLAPALFVGSIGYIALTVRKLDWAAEHSALGLAAGKTAILPAAPDILGIYGSLWRMSRNEPAPARWRALAMALSDMELQVEDDHTILLRPLAGALLQTEAEQLLRSPTEMFQPGATLRVNGMLATVRQVDAQGYPLLVAFRFDLPLLDPEHVWLEWRGGVLVPLPLPAVGSKVVLVREAGLLGV